MLTLPPLSLYVHIPWCLRKCPYCDFNSHSSSGALPEAAYVDALVADLKGDLPLAQGRKLQSIFFGGGTPSLFSPHAIGRIISSAEALIGFDKDIEITLEANPGTFEQERFRGFRQAGINRLSIGIQSFNDRQLSALGRVHDGAQAESAVAMARRAGFDNINLDLMHGLPGQSVDDASEDLRKAFALQPEHLSWYQLTIEPNTEFYSRPPQLPEEESLCDIQDVGQELLCGAGYSQYEVSAYSKPQRESQHNLNYWRFGDYLGIGAGAHGKVTLIADQKVQRLRKTRMPEHYLSTPPPLNGSRETVADGQLPLEFMMNALRLTEGVPSDSFSAFTGLPMNSIGKELDALRRRGLIHSSEDRLRTTATGFRFLNDVLAEFDPD